MIIWGWTTKNNVVEEGEFFCPQCRVMDAYQLRRVQQYFTLYFIPLFPTQLLGEFVECLGCHGTFEPGILQLSTRQLKEVFQPWTCASCQNVNPPSEARCPRCQRTRPAQIMPIEEEEAEDFLRELSDQSNLSRRTVRKKKKGIESQHWKESTQTGRCRECGVINKEATVYCRACGSRLDS